MSRIPAVGEKGYIIKLVGGSVSDVLELNEECRLGFNSCKLVCY